jgi:hypothetical protein
MAKSASTASHDDTTSAASAVLPAAVSIILTLIWGAYTVLVLIEIVNTPVPQI